MTILFPQAGYMGVLADFADLYGQHYEPPKEFFYVDALALVGAALSGRLRVDIGLPCQPRLYVNKIARSAWDRKSTSTRIAEKFVRGALGAGIGMPEIVRGVGSAEGLARALAASRRVALLCDELRRFEAKAGIQSSALLPMVNELFELNHYQNRTKDQNLTVKDGHLTFMSNSTEETWQSLLGASEFADIGFLNRMFLVHGSTSKRIARPVAPATHLVQLLEQDLALKFAALPPLNADGTVAREVVLTFTPSAAASWDQWYCGLSLSAETARLDTIGPRLMALLAFSAGKPDVDDDVIDATLALLEYQRGVREACAPIVAENPAAKVEAKIRRALERHGPLSERDVRRYTHADRDGIERFGRALYGLQRAGEVQLKNGKWELVP